MTDYRIVVDKSTVPVGTADKVRDTIRRELDNRGLSLEVDVVSNPEFLKEGAAIGDFMKPDRIIIGTDNPRTTELLRALYEPFNRSHDRVIDMDVRSAELTKYAANALLATKISFMNEVANIAERLGADIEKVRVGIGSDPRIGYHFIYPGAGYGGSCFPKDVRALARSAASSGYEPTLLNAVEEVNNRQKHRMFENIHQYFDGDLAGKTIALWGLSFKPNTDDMREAPSRVLMESLWDAGASVRAYDPEAMAETRNLYPDQDGLELCESAYDALDGADALAIMTEWQEFRSPDLERVRDALSNPVIFDGRNLYEPELLRNFGLSYYAIGRGDNVAGTTPAHRRRKTDDVRSASS
jgi:UDPglucose 6-dehydrogenase